MTCCHVEDKLGMWLYNTWCCDAE